MFWKYILTRQCFCKAPSHVNTYLSFSSNKSKSSLSPLYKFQNHRVRKTSEILVYALSETDRWWDNQRSPTDIQDFYPTWWKQDLLPLVFMEFMVGAQTPTLLPNINKLSLTLWWYQRRTSGDHVESSIETLFYFQGRVVSMKGS